MELLEQPIQAAVVAAQETLEVAAAMARRAALALLLFDM
jgi:hypothetical protein